MSGKSDSGHESVSDLRSHNQHTKSKRVQRKRVRGWRMPTNTVYVGRPSKWGNPYRLADFPNALELYRFYMKRILDDDPNFLDPLRGKDLACWCRLDRPCHADILLEFLNKEVLGC